MYNFENFLNIFHFFFSSFNLINLIKTFHPAVGGETIAEMIIKSDEAVDEGMKEILQPSI